ncbi:AMP-binding protein [Alkalihalobacterium alkalinitrilicum]|uniref:AMP-binding protein n=1 Tax=Alkalihalobacterium alkalinitrilicum TaxID=427920 RepID=UPI000994E30E|nr:AMP-binding protein [Alkalihalobacterium alkalinitrilicum]
MVEILYAVSAAGAVAVPINYMIEGETLQTLIHNSDAHYLFIEAETLSAFEKVKTHCHNLSVHSI